jgi:hypothetical protein
MIRFLTSLVVSLLLGIGIGLFLGYVQFPRTTADTPMAALAQRYQDDYTVMVAAGFLADGDLTGALERLRLLGIIDIPQHVETVTLRYIATSRALDDIRTLVRLAEPLDRLTPEMEPFRELVQPS